MHFTSPKTTLSPQARRAASAFTLIELLVVIAIIAILAAILFPVFARARENARRSSCQSNLKQISLGLIQYTQDYDERYPGSISNLLAQGGPYGWADAILPYTKSEQILQCPSEEHRQSLSPDPVATATQVGYTDYMYNGALSWNGVVTPLSNISYLTGINQAALLNSSLTVMVIEGPGGNARAAGSRSNSCGNADGAAANQPNFNLCNTGPSSRMAKIGGMGGVGEHFRHLGGSNVAFADGHVKWYITDNYTAANPAVIGTRKIYNIGAGFDTSGSSPTFNAVNQADIPLS